MVNWHPIQQRSNFEIVIKSSTKNKKLQPKYSFKSLMNSKHNNGPKFETWGTPDVATEGLLHSTILNLSHITI